jgi:hypothetical protein
MTVDELRRLLIAPEIIVLDVALAALRALERALLLEHPLLEAPPRPTTLSSDSALAPCCDVRPGYGANCAATAASSKPSSARPTRTTLRSDPDPYALDHARHS